MTEPLPLAMHVIKMFSPMFTERRDGLAEVMTGAPEHTKCAKKKKRDKQEIYLKYIDDMFSLFNLISVRSHFSSFEQQ